MRTAVPIESPRLRVSADSYRMLQNTYGLLALTLVWSAIAAFGVMQLSLSPLVGLGLNIIALLVLFAIIPFRNSVAALPMVFLFTGLMGASLGPTLQHFLAIAHGPSVVLQALGTTALVFGALTGYVLVTKKDFSWMGGMLFVGLLAVLVASIVSIFIPMVPAVHAAIGAVGVLIMSGYLLYDTSEILHGGEQNYVMATVNIYLDIFNLFTSLLRVFSFLSGDD